MKNLSLLLITLLVFSAINCEVGTWGYPEENGVIVLDDSNYKEAIGKFEFALVEFYAPWCGHCKQLAPEYEKAAKKLKNTSPAVPLIKVDATIAVNIAAELGVEGYPTMKWYSNGIYEEFDGRKAKEIVNKVTKKTGPACLIVSNEEDLDKLKVDNDILIVYFADKSTEAFKVVDSHARSVDITTAWSSDSELNARYNNQVVLFKSFEKETPSILEGDFTLEMLKEFVDENRFPVPMPFEADSALDRCFTKGNPCIFLFTKDNEETESVRNFKTAANNMKGKFIFSTAIYSTELGKNLSEYIGAKESDFPSVWIVHSGTGIDKEGQSNYIFKGDITVDAQNQYVEDFKNGKLEKEMKTQEAPATNDEPVKVIVGKTWQEYVVNSEQDVLVMFYAPWCGHCKTQKPKYNKLAKKLGHLSEKLMIAKIDSIENDVPNMFIKGFPTIKFFKAGQKDMPIDYSSGMNLKAFEKWLKKNVSFTWVESEKLALKRDQMPMEMLNNDTMAEAEAQVTNETDL